MRSSPGSGRGTGGPSPCRERRRLRPPENVSFREKNSAEKNYSHTTTEQETSSSKLWRQHQGRLIYGVIVVAAKGTKSETQSHEMLIWQVALIQVILWQMHAWAALLCAAAAAACINNFFISGQRCCQQRLNWTFRFSHSMHSRVVDINVEGEKQYKRLYASVFVIRRDFLSIHRLTQRHAAAAAAIDKLLLQHKTTTTANLLAQSWFTFRARVSWLK